MDLSFDLTKLLVVVIIGWFQFCVFCV